MDILKDLDKQKEKRVNNGQAILQEAQLLLEDTAAAERRALMDVGLDGELKLADKQLEQSFLDKQFSEKFEGKTFLIDELEEIGVKYRMFLKPAKFFKGPVPKELGSIVARLREKHNLSLNSSMNSDSGRFFIMAPPDMFKDYHTMTDKFVAEVSDTQRQLKEYAEEARKRAEARRKDPLFFYRADDEHFVLLRKFGRDFTVLRRVKGFFTQTGLLIYTAMLFLMFWMVQLPVRAWNWTNVWVKPELNDKGDIINPWAYVSSHLLITLVVGAAVLFTSIIFIRLMFRSKSWSMPNWSTRSFYRRKLYNAYTR